MQKCALQKFVLYIAVSTFCWLAVICFASAQPVLYRYKDTNDRLVLSNTIPPERADKGYQVVDQFGRVLHNVLPAATPDQIAERRLQQAQRNRKEELARRQAEEDAYLQRMYSHPDDAVRAKERKFLEIENRVSQKKIEKNEYRKKLRVLEQEAANAERSGNQVTKDTLSEINSLQRSINKIDEELTGFAQDRHQVAREYDAKIKRLKDLRSGADNRVVLNSGNLQGGWLVMSLNGKPTAENDKWEFVGDKFYQSFNGRRLSPDTFKVVGNNIELGYANINVFDFNGGTMSAELAGFDYVLIKQ